MSLLKGIFFEQKSLEKVFRDLPIIYFSIAGTLIAQYIFTLPENVVINGDFFLALFLRAVGSFLIIIFMAFIYLLIYKAVNPPRYYQ